MKRSEVTYGQLDRAMRSLGLSGRLFPGKPPALQYEHKDFGPVFTIPSFPETDFVMAHHLLVALGGLRVERLARDRVEDVHVEARVRVRPDADAGVGRGSDESTDPVRTYRGAS